MIGVDVGVDPAELGPQHALEREGGLLQDRHVDSELAGGRGHLCPDPAGADHDRACSGAKPCGKPVGIGEIAEVVDAVEPRAGERQAPRPRPGRDQQPLVAEAFASGQLDLA
jgi:hypothetical protein